MQYMDARDRIEESCTNYEEIIKIEAEMKEKPFDCYKYNSCLDEIVQNFCSFQAMIKLSKDGKNLEIFNKKPIEKVVYASLEKDPQQIPTQEFKISKSNASCQIDSIKGFIFGGTSSRFWLLRKHFNLMKLEELREVPFFSWECITLKLKDRDVDLVIRDDQQMNKLLKFLIHKLRTVDGTSGSAN